MSYTIFVSDVHLSADAPLRTKTFLQFLKAHDDADAIYILGDLFDIWVGDDEYTEFSKEIKAALSVLKIPHYFIAGNHDFLLSSGFARDTQLQLLPDPFLAEIYGQAVLLSHGDIWCTDDLAYQRYRRITRSSILQSLFLMLPFCVRCWIAHRLQKKSDQVNEKKLSYIMEVNEESVVESLDAYQSSILIHGHTHRPMIHTIAGNKKRIVLGSWEMRGEYLKWNADGQFELVSGEP